LSNMSLVKFISVQFIRFVHPIRQPGTADGSDREIDRDNLTDGQTDLWNSCQRLRASDLADT